MRYFFLLNWRLLAKVHLILRIPFLMLWASLDEIENDHYNKNYQGQDLWFVSFAVVECVRQIIKMEA